MRIPSATYRLQFTPEFRFEHADAVLDYLQRLGVTDIYASPVARAARGSEHGYDVVDPTAINDQLGGIDRFIELVNNVHGRGMGWIQDIVPNHMAVDSENRWLMDVLENGAGSRYFRFFDIKWDHYYESIRGRLLAPFLGSFYGEALENGEIKLTFDRHGLAVRYYDHALPLKIESYEQVLTHELESLEQSLGSAHADFIKYVGVVYTLTNLPSRREPEARYRQIAFGKGMLWQLYESSEPIREFIDGNLNHFNGDPDDEASFDDLDELLSQQYFRLSFWKVATEEINYRRFFTINNLISIRLEYDEVFRHTHQLILQLLTDGHVDGLRIDHVDGLLNPTQYVKRLRSIVPEAYTVVEKILEEDEMLPDDWTVEGTTGYDGLNMINGLFCAQENRRRFDRIYNRFQSFGPYEELVAARKRRIAEEHLAGDIDNLAHTMKRISSRDRHGNDITLYGLRRALVEVMAWFPVYRTYVNDDEVRREDQQVVRTAVGDALRHSPGLKYELRFIERFLLLQFGESMSEREKRELIRFVMRFQQVTGPLMAKGFEDTVLYQYNRLTSLNEVGSTPATFGNSLEDFHTFCEKRVEAYPHTMNCLATHDTKRGEDTRARINVLSELVEEWDSALKSWFRLNRKHRVTGGKREIPEKNDEYFLYQTLLGAYPFDDAEHDSFAERIREYVIKAVREAKIHTAWLKPDEEYENGFLHFVDQILRRSSDNKFMSEFAELQEKVAFYGVFNSLSQTLIKISMPGLPDFYQGTELWDLSLVDPDNRRPVDFSLREQYLREIESRDGGDMAEYARELLEQYPDGRVKLYLVQRALSTRRDNDAVFREGQYLRLDVTGEHADKVVAFAREHDGRWAVTIAPRLVASLVRPQQMPLGEVWGDTAVTLPKGSPEDWHDALAGRDLTAPGSVSVAEVFTHLPAALILG